MSPLELKHHEGRDLITVLSPEAIPVLGTQLLRKYLWIKNDLFGSELINVKGPKKKKKKEPSTPYSCSNVLNRKILSQTLRHPSWGLPTPLWGFTSGEKAKAQEKNELGYRKENLSM